MMAIQLTAAKKADANVKAGPLIKMLGKKSQHFDWHGNFDQAYPSEPDEDGPQCSTARTKSARTSGTSSNTRVGSSSRDLCRTSNLCLSPPKQCAECREQSWRRVGTRSRRPHAFHMEGLSLWEDKYLLATASWPSQFCQRLSHLLALVWHTLPPVKVLDQCPLRRITWKTAAIERKQKPIAVLKSENGRQTLTKTINELFENFNRRNFYFTNFDSRGNRTLQTIRDQIRKRCDWSRKPRMLLAKLTPLREDTRNRFVSVGGKTRQNTSIVGWWRVQTLSPSIGFSHNEIR